MVYGLDMVAVTKKQVEEMVVAEKKMLRFRVCVCVCVCVCFVIPVVIL